MWTSRREPLREDHGIKIAIDFETTPVSYAQILQLWRGDVEFRSFFIMLLAEAPFLAFRWETPPVTSETAKHPFEFVLLDAPGLKSEANPGAFAEHFTGPFAGRTVIQFSNLSGDAVLVVPCPVSLYSAYSHIGAFSREAPAPQQHALWALVGETMERRLGIMPVWLNTAGAGVPWLHVRLDDQPKYYGFAPYRKVVGPPP